MIIKKAGKTILGGQLSKAEETAMNIEIEKQMAEYDRKNANEIDAIVLWLLRRHFGFSRSKLKTFHHLFVPEISALCDRYEMHESGDELWLCTHMLKEDGIDIAEWNAEILNGEKSRE